jgi:hypothetical protein
MLWYGSHSRTLRKEQINGDKIRMFTASSGYKMADQERKGNIIMCRGNY